MAPSLIQIQNLLSEDVQGTRGLDRAPCRTRVHKHLRYVIPKVDLAVGCDGLVLHQLQVLWSQLQLWKDQHGLEHGPVWTSLHLSVSLYLIGLGGSLCCVELCIRLGPLTRQEGFVYETDSRVKATKTERA